MGNQRLDHLLSKEIREMFGMFECVNVRMSGPSTNGETSHSKNDSIIPNIRNIRSFPIYCFLKHPRQWGFSSLKIGSWKLKRITTRITRLDGKSILKRGFARTSGLRLSGFTIEQSNNPNNPNNEKFLAKRIRAHDGCLGIGRL